MNRFTNSSELAGYSKKVRVNYHEVKQEIGLKNKPSSMVKFASHHKNHPDLKAILSISIGSANSNAIPNPLSNEKPSRILKVESLQLLDFKQGISSLSDDDLQQILYSVLLATFEYGNSHRIHEWLITVNPGFQKDLEKMQLTHNTHSFDEKGRCLIAVRPTELLSKGKQLIDLWTRRFFEGGPILN
jgi:hypothetical protein